MEHNEPHVFFASSSNLRETMELHRRTAQAGEGPWYGPSFGPPPEVVGDIKVRLLKGGDLGSLGDQQMGRVSRRALVRNSRDRAQARAGWKDMAPGVPARSVLEREGVWLKVAGNLCYVFGGRNGLD